MAVNFPQNPSEGDQFTSGNFVYVYSNDKWISAGNTQNLEAIIGATGATGPQGASSGGGGGTDGVRSQQGTWTPYFDGSSGTPSIDYGLRHGEFTRVGNLVSITCRIDITTMFSNGGGSVVGKGLPYASSASNTARATGACYSSGWAGSFNPTTALITAGEAEFYLNYLNGDNESGGTPVSAFSSGLNLFTTISYITDDTTFVPLNSAAVTEDIQGTGGGGGGTDGVRHQEGTFLPRFRGSGNSGSVTYSVQEGYWSRTGNIVSFWGRLGILSASGATNIPWIQGIPYEVDSDPAAIVGNIVSTRGIENSGYLIRGATSGFYCYKQSDAGFSSMLIADFNAGASFRFSGSYLTNNTTFDPTDTVGGSGSVIISDVQGTGGGSGTTVNYNGASAWGSVAANGTLRSGLNCTVVKSGTGSYAVTFVTQMANSDYSVTTGGRASSRQVRSKTINGFTVVSVGSDGSVADNDFDFAVYSANAIAPPSGVGADSWIFVSNRNNAGSFNAGLQRTGNGEYDVTFNTPMPTSEYAVAGNTEAGASVGISARTVNGFHVSLRLNTTGAAIDDIDFSVTVHASSTVTPTYTWKRDGTTLEPANDGDDVKAKNISTAWVNFAGSSQLIRSEYNVTSITRLSEGSYRVNFTTPMDNADYAAVATSTNFITAIDNQTTNALDISTFDNTFTRADSTIICVVIYGGNG